MPESARYKALLNRIAKLKASLLPTPRIRGDYTLQEQDLTKSFRLLTHAEIESYFEERALDIANKAIVKWNTNQKVSVPLFALSCFTADITKQLRTMAARSHFIIRRYREVVKGNNGIKEANLTSLLLPIGIKETDFDPTWLSTVDSWAGLRGEIAHKTFKVHQPIDPVTEIATVSLILTGVRDIDLLFNELRLLK